jgi:hypothetical protein
LNSHRNAPPLACFWSAVNWVLTEERCDLPLGCIQGGHQAHGNVHKPLLHPRHLPHTKPHRFRCDPPLQEDACQHCVSRTPTTHRFRCDTHIKPHRFGYDTHTKPQRTPSIHQTTPLRYDPHTKLQRLRTSLGRCLSAMCQQEATCASMGPGQGFVSTVLPPWRQISLFVSQPPQERAPCWGASVWGLTSICP